MPRRYWSVGIAAFLTASTLSAQQAGDADSSQPSTEQSGKIAQGTPPPVAAAIDRIANELAETRKDQSDPYGDERDEREKRDLVAQEDSAYWAGWNFIAIIVQTFLAGGALIALVFDLRQNRKSAEAQLRAYVSVKPEGLRVGMKGGTMEAYIKLHNGGTTPAYDCYHGGRIVAMTDEAAEKEFQLTAARQALGRANPFVLHGGEDADGAVGTHDPFTTKTMDALAKNELALFVFGFAQYRDIFGQKRVTRFCYRASGLAFDRGREGEIIPLQWMIAPYHNDAT